MQPRSNTRHLSRWIHAGACVLALVACNLSALAKVPPASQPAAKVFFHDDFDQADHAWVGAPSRVQLDWQDEDSTTFLHLSWQRPPGTVYLYRTLEAPPRGDVILRMRFRLSVPAQYIALGWIDADGTYQHVRLRHTAVGRWETLVVRSGSILGQLSHMGQSRRARQPHAIRIIATGLRQPDGALDVDRIELVDAAQAPCDPLVLGCDLAGPAPVPTRTPPAALRELHASLRGWDPSVEIDRARLLRDEGVYQIPYPATPIKPPAQWDGIRPPNDNPTVRYLWHALDPVHFLIRAWWETKDPWYLDAAAQHARRWLDRYLAAPVSADERYVWYDHGTAFRAIELAVLYHELKDRDAYAALRTRILDALCLHAELLSSPAFIAWNQPMRYHNHAVFQAVALVVLGAYVPDLPAAARLRGLGVSRIEYQLRHLVNADGATVENTLGYDLAVLQLTNAIDHFLRASGTPDARLDATIAAMRNFAARIIYPDGTLPAYGDNWYGHTANLDVPPRSDQRVSAFPDSGYVALRRLDDTGAALQVDFFASAQTITHKHEDYLSITCWRGRRWLIDPGFYDYSESPHTRSARQATAHNVLLLPAYRYRIAPEAARITDTGQNDLACWVTGEHTAQAGFVIHRRVAVLRDRPVVFVEDRVESLKGKVAAAHQWFHAAPDLTVTIRGPHEVVLTDPKTSRRCRVISLAPAQVGLVTCFGDTASPRAGWYYPAFHTARPAPAWRFHADSSEPMLTALVFEDAPSASRQTATPAGLREQWERLLPTMTPGSRTTTMPTP